MEFLKKIGEKLGIIEEDTTAKINAEREKIKETMKQNLSNIGFTKEEIDEVLNILIESEKEVQKQKDLLIGTNINVDDVNLVMRPIFEEIRRLELKAAADIKVKIAEIKARKLEK